MESSSSSSSSLPTKGGRATLSNITGGDGGTMRSKMVGKVKLSRNNNNNNNPFQSSTTKANENTTTSSSYFSALAATILAEEQVPPPPDKRLKSMDILIDKKLQGSPHLSVEDYHQKFWNNDAFYAAWLQQSLGKTNVHVGQWQTNTMASSNDENGVGGDLSAVIVNPWDGETYDCMRVVTFQFQRASTTTHCLSTTAGRSNPPAMMKAHVTQTQYCRVDEGMNRGVVSTTIATRGVPFSDAFNVQLRWVATRVLGAGPAASSYDSPLHIQVGMVVVFTKPVIVANKIRAGVKEETTKSQVHLFRCMKKACCSSNLDEELDGRAVPLPQASRRRKSAVDDLLLLAKDRVHVPASFHRRLARAVGMCFPFLSKNDNGHDREVLQGEKNNNTVQDELDKVQRMLRTVRALPQSITTMTAKNTQRAHVLSQCSVVQKALNAIVVRERYLEKSRAAAQRNRLAAQSSRNIKNNNGINNNDQQVPPALKTIAKLYDNMVDHVRSVTPRNLQFQNGPVEEAAFDAGPDPEPDKVLKGMNVIVSNTIHNATVMDVYKLLAGGDDNDNDKLGESFYRSWLESTERRNVEIEPWSTAPPGEPCFADGWSNETFKKRRVVTARVLKSKFMKDAPPAVLAKQTMQQFCRLHDHDRLVMASSIKVDHFAFANTFEVCIRWVVSRVGSCDVSVKIGVFVLFLQPTMLESKIRTGALKESQRLQLDLFHRIRDAINSNNGSTGTTPRRFSFDDKMLASSMASRGSTIPTSATWFIPIEQFCIPKMQKLTRLYPACMLEDDAALQHEFQQIQLQLQTVKLFLPAAGKETSSDLAATMENDDVGYNGENDKKASEKRSTFIQSELRVAYEALDNVVVWHGNAQYGKQTLAAASFVNNTSS
jgi:VAD1 Analog of StAR-related lipid transfer domain